MNVEVVVIGLNEELFIRACIESVRQAWAGYSDTPIKVTYIDSGSSDRSREVARKAGARVFEIHSVPSAAAARQVGLREATSEWILFLDADMRLDVEWFRYCAGRADLLGDEGVGGVIGRRADYLIAADGSTERVVQNVYRVTRERPAPHLGGALLARRSALKAVGGYRIELRGGEEPELLARLLQAGFRVQEIPADFIDHYWDERPGVWDKLRRWCGLRSETRRTFGHALLHAAKGGYIGSFMRVYRWTALVWFADTLSVAVLPNGRWEWCALLQLASLLILMHQRKRSEWLLSRGRAIGVIEAAFEQMLRRGARTPGLRYSQR
ncbi:MAG: glycosyltransferase family A protein [Rhodospirillaceae bacterium]